MEQEKKKTPKLKIIIPIILIMLIIAIVTITIINKNNKNKYYSNTSFLNLKTFTDVTGINEKNIEEKGTKVSYIYQFQDTPDFITDYESYLLNEYGFSINQDKTEETLRYFEYDNKTLIAEEETSVGFTTYTVTIPLTDEIASKNSERDYNSAIELVENGEYDEARKIFENILEYKDVKVYVQYCIGMNYYNYKYYGLALEQFKKCEDILNAKELEDEMSNIVSKYNGTYYYQHPKTSSLGYYMYIKDGKVDIQSKNSYSNTVYYSYSLVGKLNENTQQYDLYVATRFIDKPELKNYEFLFLELPDGGITISSQNGSVNTMYSGVYDKTSNTAP